MNNLLGTVSYVMFCFSFGCRGPDVAHRAGGCASLAYDICGIVTRTPAEACESVPQSSCVLEYVSPKSTKKNYRQTEMF